MGCNNSKRCCFYKGPTQKERREALAERARLQALEIRERAVLDKVRAREENLAGALLTTLCRAYINCPRYGRHEWMHQGPADGSRYRLLGVKRKINYAAQTLGEQLMLGYAVRCRYEKAIYSAVYIERVERGRQVRAYYRMLHMMATRIQSAWRGMHFRRMMAELRWNLAANALQHAARVHMAKLELLRRKRERAAITIQWWWRRRAKMRIWMAIRYMKAAARIQGGFRGMKQRQARKAAYMASRRKVKDFMVRIKLDRHLNTLERLRISYEELLTLKRYNVAGFRSDAALGAKVGRNKGLHIHGYDATALARHIKAEQALYEKSQANKRKWALMRAKPAAATRIARTYRGHAVRKRRLDEYLEQPGHGELLKFLRQSGLGRRTPHFEKRRITYAIVTGSLENDGAQLGGEEDPELWDWGWKRVSTSKNGRIPWGLLEDERGKLLGKLRLRERMRLAKQALAEQRQREKEEAERKKREEEERRAERKKEMAALAERRKREAEHAAQEAREKALHILRWREREREEAERLATAKEAARARVQALVTQQEVARRSQEAKGRDIAADAARLEEAKREAAAAVEAEALAARVRAVTALRAGRSVRLHKPEVVATALAATSTSGRVVYAEEEVAAGWPDKIRHCLESGVVLEIDAADQTVLLRLPVDSAAAQAAKQAEVASASGAAGSRSLQAGAGRMREIWYPVEALDTAGAEREMDLRAEAASKAAEWSEASRREERQRQRELQAREEVEADMAEGAHTGGKGRHQRLIMASDTTLLLGNGGDASTAAAAAAAANVSGRVDWDSYGGAGEEQDEEEEDDDETAAEKGLRRIAEGGGSIYDVVPREPWDGPESGSVADWQAHCARLRRTARGLVGLDFKLMEAVHCLEECVQIAEGFGLMEERAGCLEELAILHRQRKDISPEMVDTKAAACEKTAEGLRARLRLKGVGLVPRESIGSGDYLAAEEQQGQEVGAVLRKARQRSQGMEKFLNDLKQKDVNDAPQEIRPPKAVRASHSRSRSRSRSRSGSPGRRRHREQSEGLEMLQQAEFLTGAVIADAAHRTAMSGYGLGSGGGEQLLPDVTIVRPRSVVDNDGTTLALLNAIGPEAGRPDLKLLPVLLPPPSAVSPRELAPLSGRGVESGRGGPGDGWRSDGMGGKVAVASPALHAAHLRTLEGAHSFGGPPPNDKARGVQLMAVQQMDGQHGDVDARTLKLPPPVVSRRAAGGHPMHQVQSQMLKVPPKLSSTG